MLQQLILQEEKPSMPVALSYPGVYVEEIPSGVRTITGVATSITAFVGQTISGPTNKPITVFSFGDFQRRFGGLGAQYPLSYAVADFFRNGGGQAVIVRLFKAAGATGKGTTTVAGLKLEAATPGKWSNDLEIVVDNANISADAATRLGVTTEKLFNLTATLTSNGQIVARERFLNLTAIPNDSDAHNLAGKAQRIDRVLIQSSQLLRVPVKADKITPDLPDDTNPFPPKPGTDFNPKIGTLSTPGPDGHPKAGVSQGMTSADNSQPLLSSDVVGDRDQKTGMFALEKVDLFNLLCIPPDVPGGNTPKEVYAAAMEYCKERRAMLVVDPPNDWGENFAVDDPAAGLTGLGFSADLTRNAAIYFPRVKALDPLSNGQEAEFVPCGLVAGAMAATDAQRGVWKAPAGIDVGLNGISGLAVNLTNNENGILNQLGINCLRNFPIYGNIVWGARTLRGADQLADEYKYIPVRRLALYIEESLFRGTQWVVFEPNDEPLWAQIRLNIGAFMHNLFVKGAFQGQTPAAAYFVKCDKDTTTQNDIDLGIVNIRVGFAPLKPAEFVVLQIQQIAGNILT
jgi:uncharacterized protein